jgi:hypothetical protein
MHRNASECLVDASSMPRRCLVDASSIPCRALRMPRNASSMPRRCLVDASSMPRRYLVDASSMLRRCLVDALSNVACTFSSLTALRQTWFSRGPFKSRRYDAVVGKTKWEAEGKSRQLFFAASGFSKRTPEICERSEGRSRLEGIRAINKLAQVVRGLDRINLITIRHCHEFPRES